jgi:hypothetical protein
MQILWDKYLVGFSISTKRLYGIFLLHLLKFLRMKKALFFLLVSFVFSAEAQIIITSSNMPNANDTLRVSTGDILTLLDPANTPYTTTGPNVSWTFDSLKATGQTIRKFESVGSSPYVYFFSSSYGEKTADSLNLGVIAFTNIYNYYKKSSSAFTLDGLGMTYSSFPIPNFYSDKDELYKFPLMYGDHDSSTFKFSTLTYSALAFPKYKKEGYRITDVDGWGMISTPLSPVPVPCIRVTTTAYSQDSIIGDLALGTFTIPLNIGFPNYQRSIQWLTLTERIPYFQVDGSYVFNTFIPTSVKYRDIPRAFVGISEVEEQKALGIYPNPATNELNLFLPKSKDLSLEIYSSTGQLVLKKELSNNEMMNLHKVNVSEYAVGLYSGRLSGGGSVQNFKFIKQ